jgi:dipeptidyl aminopeptidase/acylaminoacyl peptidase
MDDWGYYVAFGTQTEYPPTPEQYMQMYAISPISKLTSITCPVFLAAGGSDPRVTPNCTLEMFRTLKHLNKDVEFYLFPKDGHAFEQTKTGFELLARTFIWALNKFGSN